MYLLVKLMMQKTSVDKLYYTTNMGQRTLYDTVTAVEGEQTQKQQQRK
jgi:hypothetical protein